ncbi:hypothetical protein L596_014708 [Steinernema carpocapsae]|nr:hypothetical protein L596_014708 [Steinernema carpocapsae]
MKFYHGFFEHRHVGLVYDRFQVLGVADGQRNGETKYQVALAEAYPLEGENCPKESPGTAFIIDPYADLSEEICSTLEEHTEYFEAHMTKLKGYVFGKQVYCPRFGNLRFDLKKQQRGIYPSGTAIDFDADVGNDIYFTVKNMRPDPKSAEIRAVDTLQGPVFCVSVKKSAQLPELVVCHQLSTLISDPKKRIVDPPKEAEKKKKKGVQKEKKEEVYSVWVIEDVDENSVARFKVLDMQDKRPETAPAECRYDYPIRSSMEPPEPNEDERQSVIISRAPSVMSTRPSRVSSVALSSSTSGGMDSYDSAESSRPLSAASSMTLPAMSPTPSTIVEEPDGDIFVDALEDHSENVKPFDGNLELYNSSAAHSDNEESRRTPRAAVFGPGSEGGEAGAEEKGERESRESSRGTAKQWEWDRPLSEAPVPQSNSSQPNSSQPNAFQSRPTQSGHSRLSSVKASSESASEPKTRKTQESVFAPQAVGESTSNCGSWCKSAKLLERLYKKSEIRDVLKQKKLYLSVIGKVAKAKAQAKQ